MKGKQRRLDCPNCHKVFFAWRPDELPGAQGEVLLLRAHVRGRGGAAAAAPAPAPAAPPPPLRARGPAPPAPPAATPEPS